MQYSSMTAVEREKELPEARAALSSLSGAGLRLDLSRGKPTGDQLELAMPLLSDMACFSADGTDCRNYGGLEGLPEMRRLFSDLTGVPYDYIIAGGNSSLTMMYDTVARAMLYGVCDSPRPWCREEKVRFLCPVPGYDRHFRICESLGIEMIPVDMDEHGPDMDAVEALVSDPSVKGIWCVPKYSNPTGVTYSDEVVRRLCRMATAAPDFRIFWDNAYVIHDLYDESTPLADIFAEARAAGHENRVFYFTSTSKITFPGGGVAMMAANRENLAQILPILGTQTIGPDKMNQLRHARYLRDAAHTRAVMRQQAALIRPKFEAVEEIFARELGPRGIAAWSHPLGGYFISLDLPDGTARRTYDLARAAGVTLTPAGATYPYGRDARDRNLRIAPTYATLEEARKATEILCAAVRVAVLEQGQKA